MRDPNRIHDFCMRLEDCWMKQSDWRFGQLMVNLLGSAGRDPFFIEDDEMIAIIESYFEG